MKQNGLFITGTDTNVGKTFVTSLLAASYRSRGVDIGVFKPMMSGVKREDVTSDVSRLKAYAQDSNSLQDITPFSFDEPLAPYMAAKRQGTTVSLKQVVRAWERIRDRHACYLVEGAGGIAVPLGPSYLVADVANAIGFPVLIVARAGLGTVNHTLLTVAFARQKGLDVIGVIINKTGKADRSEKTNPQLIEAFCGVPVLGSIPELRTISRQTAPSVASRYISLEKLDLAKKGEAHEGMER